MSGEAVFEGSCGLSYVLVSGSASLTFYEVYYIGGVLKEGRCLRVMGSSDIGGWVLQVGGL